MMNLLFSLIIFYLVFYLSGFWLKKIKIPKIYAALFLGIIFSLHPTVITFTHQPLIRTFSNLGMFLLLFFLGFNLNLKEIKHQKKLIIKTTFWVIISEILVGSLFLYFLFHLSPILTVIIATSFATVGEVALLPILKEYQLIPTQLGQTILGISILDDLVEIIAFVSIIFYLSSVNLSEIFIESLPLMAIIAGALVSHFTRQSTKLEKLISFLSLNILGPFFFLSAGSKANLSVIFNQIFLIISLTLLIKGTKLTAAFLNTHQQFGLKKSIILGLSLCIKFSTSIIILMMLLEKNLIPQALFSLLIGTTVLFKFIIPLLLSYLLTHWHLNLIPFKKD